MNGYRRNRHRVDKALRESGIVVVISRDHVQSAGDMVITMTEIHRAGFVAEITFRIDEGILREGMQELTVMRNESPPDRPLILGVGSVINRTEIDAAINKTPVVPGVVVAVQPDIGNRKNNCKHDCRAEKDKKAEK